MELDHNWLLLPKAAERSGFNPDHVRRLCRQGAIEAQKLGRDWLVSWPSLRAYVLRWHPEQGAEEDPC